MSENAPTRDVLEAHLQEADAEITKLQAKLKRKAADENIRQQLEEQINELQQKRSEFKQNLEKLKDKSGASMKEIEKGAKQAWTDLSSAIKRAANEFK